MIHKVCCLTRPNPGAPRRTFPRARPRRAYLIPLEETFVGRTERRRAYVGTIKGQKHRWGPFSTFPNTQWPESIARVQSDEYGQAKIRQSEGLRRNEKPAEAERDVRWWRGRSVR